MKNEKLTQLALYLTNKYDVNSPLKLQKMLFFIRIEEIKSNNNKNKLKSEFFKENYNFEAWINGPVEPNIYRFMRPYFLNLEIEDQDYTYDVKKYNFKKLDGYIQKYLKYDAYELRDLSHKNKGWISARNGIKENEISNEKIDENLIWDEN